ncbi:hypothetical protein AgCh_015882 [Apium graveolens]
MELEAKIKEGKAKSCTWREMRILRQLNPTAELLRKPTPPSEVKGSIPFFGRYSFGRIPIHSQHAIIPALKHSYH